MVSVIHNPEKQRQPLHILHLASGDLWAGAEVMLYTLASSQHQDFNSSISVILLNPGRLEVELRNCGIEVFIVDESRLNSWQTLQQIDKIIADTQPDVIHTHRIKENIFGSVIAFRNGRIPCLRTQHGAQEHRPSLHQLPGLLKQYIDWLCGRYYQKVIVAVSQALAEQLESYFPRSKIKVIENGIDVNSLAPSGLPAHIRSDKDNYRIGIIGRLMPVKRVDLFISCALYLKQFKPALNIDFFIYGDGTLSEQLQSIAQSEGAEKYIHFEGHCDNVAEQLRSLDALLMTSDHEGLPMVLLEAMCMNTPIIAHAVGGIPNLLDHGKCGVLVNDHRAEAFAKAIIDLIEQPEKHRQLALLAFQRVNQYYSAQKTAAEYNATYLYMVNND